MARNIDKVMRDTFMAGSVQGTKSEIKKANRMANLIISIVILSFIIVLISVISVKAQSSNETSINMMDEIDKPFQTVLDNLKLDKDVNTVEHGVNRQGKYFIFTRYYDTGNTVRHLFNKKRICTTVEFRSTNFRDYKLFNKAINDTVDYNMFTTIKGSPDTYNIDIKITKSLWFIRVKKN